MHASISFQQIGTSPSSTRTLSALHSTISGLVQWIGVDRPQRCNTRKKSQTTHFYWILISLNIFIALAYCDDDLIAPSTQPFPQKRSGGKSIENFEIYLPPFWPPFSMHECHFPYSIFYFFYFGICSFGHIRYWFT